MARRKAAALDVPESEAAAVSLVAAYVADERRVLELKLGYEVLIDQLKARRDSEIAALAGEQQGRFAALKSWWEAGGKDRAGRNRSAPIAGATLGIRLTPPAVKFARGVTAAKVIEWLKTSGWSKAGELVRTKVELDKPAIIKCVADSQGEEDLLAEAGVTVVQTDEFFIDCGLDEAAIRARLAAPGSTDKE